jgi:hypothetical protein
MLRTLKFIAFAVIFVFSPNSSFGDCLGSNCLGSGGLTLGPNAFQGLSGSGLKPQPRTQLRAAEPLTLSKPATLTVDPLYAAQQTENDEMRWLTEHNTYVIIHYATLVVTLGQGGTLDEDELRDEISQITEHAANLQKIKNRICSLEKERGVLTGCQPLKLQVNPNYEVSNPQSTYQGAPIYVPNTSTDSPNCEYSSKIGQNGCVVH